MMGIFRVVFAATVVLIRSSSVDGLPLVQFYPFGVAIDRRLSPNDDTSSVPIHLNTPFPYFDEDVNTVYVSFRLGVGVAPSQGDGITMVLLSYMATIFG